MGTADLSVEAAADVQDAAKVPEKGVFYRRVFFQATVVGFCAFLAPGLYNAMQSTGAGGQQSPYLVMYVPYAKLITICASTDVYLGPQTLSSAPRWF